mmetsp:Transcript_4644/g.11525  ORF Transcript_4644/g.11525 Transcript_4644/m.11525 type:complete len:602 (+) Transcript_4644:132-1937(+)|eukprot:CAMPEP_0177650990 /NCGR_PEP_ID=MMETSP0447-20121125/12272_1 /TAXON_ID=0 /ORGANISM="Stygamoeba regulata, Strain BSH-02190019" /LENGTH=601 /DNA_ID=CAMNT_0019153967 /DNA_START=128 /DNA_END=1933 /DNA_ORIENTATION=-
MSSPVDRGLLFSSGDEEDDGAHRRRQPSVDGGATESDAEQPLSLRQLTWTTSVPVSHSPASSRLQRRMSRQISSSVSSSSGPPSPSPPSSSTEHDDRDRIDPKELLDFDHTSVDNLLSVPELRGWDGYWRDWCACFIIGTINNMAYVVVNSSAQNLATNFQKCWIYNLIGLIPGCNVAAGFFARALNTFGMTSVPFKWRMFINGVVLFLGLILLAIASEFSFVVSLIIIIVLGGTSSFGESVFLCNLNVYPPELLDGWSSGTGMAGVLGSGIYLLLSGVAGLKLYWIYLIQAPFALIYVLCYFFMLRPPSHYARYMASEKEKKLARAAKLLPSDASVSGTMVDERLTSVEVMSSVETTSSSSSSSSSAAAAASSSPVSASSYAHLSETQPLLGAASTGSVQLQEGEVPPETQLKRHWRIFLQTLWWGGNLGAVYFFEYVASTGAADRANPPGALHSSHWVLRNSYAILSFVYQVGVLISRSSLKLIKIRHVEVLTLLQALNFGLWLAQDSEYFLPISAQIVLMLYVGLLGGASYANIFYFLLNEKDASLPDEDLELSINIVAMWITIGIAASSIFVVLMDNTWLAVDAGSALGSGSGSNLC